MMVPESLNPELRLMRLSARSPKTPMQPATTPKAIACTSVMVTPGTKEMAHQNSTEPTNPAKKPSQLFLGLVRGASLWRPILLPTR